MIKISSLRSKFLLIVFTSTVLPLAFLGFYTTSKFSSQITENAQDNSEKLKIEAENNLLRNIKTKSDELSNFFEEARKDLESFTFTVTMKHNSAALQNEYRGGELFLYWAMSDWKKYLDRNKLDKFLRGEEINESYEKLKLYIDSEDELKLEEFLSALSNGYEELNEKNYQEEENYYPRFLINKDIFYDLKSISDKAAAKEEPYLFLNLMYEFLNEEGKSFLNKGFFMMMPGRALVDNHDTYRNLRLGYWGDGNKGIEMIYAKTNQPLHPAIASIGNSYYCKSKFSLIQNNLDPLLQHSDVLGDKKVSVLIYPIFEKFNDKNSKLIGFAEYWMDWTVFSQKLSEYNFYSDEHNFLVNKDGVVVSDNDHKHLGLNIYEINGDMKNAEDEIKRTKFGFVKFMKEGQEYYVFFNEISDAGLRLFSIVPSYSFIKLADDEKNHAIHHIKQMEISNFTIVAIIIVLVSLISFYFSTSVTKPLKNLSLATRRISNGDLNIRVEKKSNDEIGELAENFNQMADELSKKNKDVDNYRKNLEKEVKLRTKELEESKKKMENKLYELEIYSKATTDRELKMIELKEKIKNLEELLKLKK